MVYYENKMGRKYVFAALVRSPRSVLGEIGCATKVRIFSTKFHPASIWGNTHIWNKIITTLGSWHAALRRHLSFASLGFSALGEAGAQITKAATPKNRCIYEKVRREAAQKFAVFSIKLHLTWIWGSTHIWSRPTTTTSNPIIGYLLLTALVG